MAERLLDTRDEARPATASRPRPAHRVGPRSPDLNTGLPPDLRNSSGSRCSVGQGRPLGRGDPPGSVGAPRSGTSAGAGGGHAKYSLSDCPMPEMRSMSGPTGAPLTDVTASGARPRRDPIHCYQRRSMDCCSACRAVSREDVAFGSGLGGGLGLSFMVATFVERCDESRRKGAAGPGGGRTSDSGRDRRPSRRGRLTDRCSTTEP